MRKYAPTREDDVMDKSDEVKRLADALVSEMPGYAAFAAEFPSWMTYPGCVDGLGACTYQLHWRGTHWRDRLLELRAAHRAYENILAEYEAAKGGDSWPAD